MDKTQFTYIAQLSGDGELPITTTGATFFFDYRNKEVAVVYTTSLLGRVRDWFKKFKIWKKQ